MQRQAAGDMQRGRPADLDVTRAVRRDVLDQLARDARQRLLVLHDRDGQIEGAQQLGLVAAALRRDQPLAHGSQVHALVEAALSCELERRLRPQAPVEVEVQLGLGHAREKVAQFASRRFALPHAPIVRQRAAAAVP